MRQAGGLSEGGQPLGGTESGLAACGPERGGFGRGVPQPFLGELGRAARGCPPPPALTLVPAWKLVLSWP